MGMARLTWLGSSIRTHDRRLVRYWWSFTMTIKWAVSIPCREVLGTICMWNYMPVSDYFNTGRLLMGELPWPPCCLSLYHIFAHTHAMVPIYLPTGSPFDMLSNGMFYFAIHALVHELQVEMTPRFLKSEYQCSTRCDKVILPWLLINNSISLVEV